MLEGLREASSNRLAVGMMAASVALTCAGAAQETAYATETSAVSAQGEEYRTLTPTDRENYEKLLDASRERAEELSIRRLPSGKLATKTVDGTTYYLDCNRIIDGWVTAVQTDPTTPGVTPFNASISKKKMCRDDRISKKEAPAAKKAFRGLLGSFLQA